MGMETLAGDALPDMQWRAARLPGAGRSGRSGRSTRGGRRGLVWTAWWLGWTLALAGCGGGSGSSTPSGSGSTLSASAEIGRQIFADKSLSASGQQACASCHVAEFGHSPDNARAAQLGGAGLDQSGTRKAPTIRYLERNTAFFFAGDGTPTGGFFWDGRADSLAHQAGEPLLNPLEMANDGKAALVQRVAAAPYAADLKQLYGDDLFNDTQTAFTRIELALQKYQQEDADFHPYSSKYDAFLKGTATLSAAERRGLVLFNDPKKGNCAACHPSARGADGALPLFTDFSYDNLGVPRNTALPANADPAHYDLGLCARSDLTHRIDLCGAFKVPSLRNVAVRKAFFHNGRFTTLKEALTFYVQRDTNPEKWYPRNADGTVQKFDDLPEAYHRNVNTTEAPYNRQLGGTPALSDTEIDDVIAFLETLTDGYEP